MTPEEVKKHHYKNLGKMFATGAGTSAIPFFRGPEALVAHKLAPEGKKEKAAKSTFGWSAAGASTPLVTLLPLKARQVYKEHKATGQPFKKIVSWNNAKKLGKIGLIGAGLGISLGGLGAAYGFHRAVKPKDYNV